jgi:hypothetical protein
MSGIRTGNPIPRLWTFAAAFPSREEAVEIESVLLQHMAAHKAHGEWVHVHGLSEQAAAAMAQSLGEVAARVLGHPAHFERVE